MATKGQHGEGLFDNAQQARALLQDCGFIPLAKTGQSEHWVRGGRRCILIYDGNPGETPLDGCEYVWFVASADPDDPVIIPVF
jgi:hypothetical protein